MKKIFLLLIGIIVFVAACSNGGSSEQVSQHPLEMDWMEVEEQAKGTEVHLYMWGGDDGINRYIDEWVSPKLKADHDITLTRHPMDTADFISKLMTEKKAGKEKGTIDIIWINGENFKNAKENALLWDSFATKLPSVNDYIGTDQAFVKSDMGTDIDGLEAPWGKVQFVFHYNDEKVTNPPKSFQELEIWIKEHPGQFTYPNVNDFSGNAFVRHLMYSVADEEVIRNGFNEEWVTQNGKQIWDKLNTFEKSLWRNGETYPENLSQLDQLFASGEVSFTMGFNEKRVDSLIEDGILPESTKPLVLEPGSIGNTHYLSIPFNSPNKLGAMTAINFMLSPEAQIAKMDPNMWGEGMVIDQTKLSSDQLKMVKEFGGESSVESDDILVELNSQYADWIKENWENEVVQK